MGTVSVTASRVQHMDFQFREVPNWQPALSDLRVRQALLHAMDRAGLNDVANERVGGSVADAFILPNDEFFPDVDRAVTKYPYDMTRAGALLADAGFRRAGTEGRLTSAAGQPLTVEVWATFDAQNLGQVIARNWQDAGVDASVFVVPANRAADGEFRTSFTGVSLSNRPALTSFFAWTSNQLPNERNRFSGGNRGSWSNPETDRLYDAVVQARGKEDSRQAMVALNRQITANLGTSFLFYPADVVMMRSNVTGPIGHNRYPATSWNVFEWAIAG
jgi:ABC-type transport system substrate-binding protein